MIKIICNKCGKEIDSLDKVGNFRLNVVGCFTGEESLFDGLHCCADCSKKVKEFIMSKSESSEGEPKPHKTVSNDENSEQKSRKRVDIGKIIALKKAGWSNKKIADEMGMTANSVAQNIYRYKEKQGE